MSIRFKIFLAFFILFVAGIFQITRDFNRDVRKSYLECLEENMVDSANILAEIAAENYQNGKFDVSFLKNSMKRADKRNPAAAIYKLKKKTIDADVYLTDSKGYVLFNSCDPKTVGKFFGNWNDVHKCLRGEYGARSTRLDKDNPASSVIHVAAPVVVKGKIVGVLSYIKPIIFTTFFIEERKASLKKTAVIISLIALVIFVIFSEWIAAPILRLTAYAKALANGDNPKYPRLGLGEVARLGKAFEEMRRKLDGKKYIEDYVRALTHELKSPLSAVRGAVELLEDEKLPSKQREKFLAIIRQENSRMAEQVDRMLHLSRLEGHSDIGKFEKVNIAMLIKELIQDCETLTVCKRNFSSKVSGELFVNGDRFLLKEAINNLVRNAIDFTVEKGNIEIKAHKQDGRIIVEVIDDGVGIPDYAKDKIFDKFYSLARPENGQKSSGLGLSIVRQIMILHSGEILLENNKTQGAKAVLIFDGKLK